MRLTQENLDRYCALYALFLDGSAVGIEPCESYGDLELPLYDNLGTVDEPVLEVRSNETYAGPFDTLDELLESCPELKKMNWVGPEGVSFH